MKDIKYNKTQLSPDKTFERHVFHRDQFAHYLRWTHVLKIAKINMNVLDIGCGSGNLAELLYRNRYKANKYLGLDIRKQTVKIANDKYSKVKWIEFKEIDVCEYFMLANISWDIIVCFEVVEHVGKQNLQVLLQNLKQHMNENTILLLSTPNYDKNVGAASNHVINNEISEYTFEELHNILKKDFIIDSVYGTFASQKDYKEYIMQSKYKEFFIEAQKYYDTNVLSVLMAPVLEPWRARNCLWKLKKKH